MLGAPLRSHPSEERLRTAAILLEMRFSCWQRGHCIGISRLSLLSHGLRGAQPARHSAQASRLSPFSPMRTLVVGRRSRLSARRATSCPAVDSQITQGFLAGLLAGLATGIGALGVYSVRRLSRAGNDLLLSSAAGIMLAATFFSLLGPAIEAALAGSTARLGAAAIVAAGLLAGAGALALIHRLVPHEHFSGEREGSTALHVRRIWLFVLAITLHNIPEGMAVGVGFGAGDVTSGLPLAVGIGLQNVPEGLAVAAGLTSIGYAPTRAFLLSLATGVLESVGALFGAAGAALAGGLLPFALAFAAGAMLFVIASEIIPETAREETKIVTTFALLAGFLVMMTLDIVLG